MVGPRSEREKKNRFEDRSENKTFDHSNQKVFQRNSQLGRFVMKKKGELLKIVYRSVVVSRKPKVSAHMNDQIHLQVRGLVQCGGGGTYTKIVAVVTVMVLVVVGRKVAT